MKKLNVFMSFIISSFLLFSSFSVFAESIEAIKQTEIVLSQASTNYAEVLSFDEIDFANAYEYKFYQNVYRELEAVGGEPIVISWTVPEYGSYTVETLGDVAVMILCYNVDSNGNIVETPSVYRPDENLHTEYTFTSLGNIQKYLVLEKCSDYHSPGSDFLFRIVRTDQTDDATNYLDIALQNATDNDFSSLINDTAQINYSGDVDIYTYNVAKSGTAKLKFENGSADLNVTVYEDSNNIPSGVFSRVKYNLPSETDKTYSLSLPSGNYYIMIKEAEPDPLNENLPSTFDYSFEFVPPGYPVETSVSGTVSSYSAPADIDDSFREMHEMVVYAKTSVLGDVVTSAIVESDGSYQLDLAPGNYVLAFERAGFLTRYTPVTVGNTAVTVPDKTLLKGDVNGDGVINQTDSDLVSEKIAAQYPSANYDPACDFDGNGSITVSDLGDVTLNINKTIESYGENIVIPGVSGKITPVVNTGDPDFDALHTVTVTLKRASDGATVAVTEANKATGNYSFIAPESGNFIIEFKRPGYLTRQTTVTFGDEKITLPDKDLMAGDVDGNGVINTDDSTSAISKFGAEYPDAEYDPACDIDCNTIINTDDLTTIISNFGKTTADYEE